MGLFNRKANEVVKANEKELFADDFFGRKIFGLTDNAKNSYVDAYFKVKEFIDAGEIDKAKAYYDVLIAREKDLLNTAKYYLTMERMQIDRDLGV